MTATATVGSVTERARDRLCWMAAVLVIVVGILVWVSGRPSMGLAVASDAGGPAVVTDVTPGALAWAAGVQPGMTVTSVDWSPPSAGFTGSEGHVAGRATLVDERDGRRVEVTPYTAASVLLLPGLWAAIALLVAMWMLARRSSMAAFAAPFALATATPLALLPATAFGSPDLLAVNAIAWPLAALPLGATMAGQARCSRTVRRARQMVVAGTVGAVALVPLLYVVPGPASSVALVRVLLVALALLGPLALIATTRVRQDGAWTNSGQPLVRTLTMAALAATPIVIHLALGAPDVGIAVVGIALWCAAALVVARFVVAPLAALTTRALGQRDLVAAAADAERRRVAADLHDGPLQSLTLLAYRLDAAGDVENAGLARDVVTELRAVTSALRLPVVDDLGAGPALEWLATQVGRLSGQDIELQRADSGRPPIDVEHAVFRIAQEALANATRHGRPPIRVRYEAASSRASLVIDDAGPGVTGGRVGEAERGLGLVGMRERAESIGAVLEIGSAAGHSRVSLLWPAGAP